MAKHMQKSLDLNVVKDNGTCKKKVTDPNTLQFHEFLRSISVLKLC